MTEEFYQLEHFYGGKGIPFAGADEAGRGPLAGPVVAAAVIMPNDHYIEGIDDSKKLSAKKRDALYETIIQNASDWAIGRAEVEEIERFNILGAARLAFQRAIGGLKTRGFVLYTDYITGLDLDMEYTPLKKGDARVYSIAAASILAKVTRDRVMEEYDLAYPEYGFAAHKGYGTAAHRQAILTYGACPIHRPSFLKKITGWK